ncbi:hypothetical protein E2320_013704 [Naja naja]|nr:hypothetical protein E2320_013704 [Naja naja]
MEVARLGLGLLPRVQQSFQSSKEFSGGGGDSLYIQPNLPYFSWLWHNCTCARVVRSSVEREEVSSGHLKPQQPTSTKGLQQPRIPLSRLSLKLDAFKLQMWHIWRK